MGYLTHERVLGLIGELVVTALDTIALLVIAVATIEVSINLVCAAIKALGNHQARTVWPRYARWLVAALTFQLAADILESSVTTSWQTIGRLGAIAVIRTFLDHFIERDLEQQRREDDACAPSEQAQPRHTNVATLETSAARHAKRK